MIIRSSLASFKVINLYYGHRSKKENEKQVISSFNFEFQKTLLWLLFQDVLVILRGTLAHGGMFVFYTSDNFQFNVLVPHN